RPRAAQRPGRRWRPCRRTSRASGSRLPSRPGQTARTCADRAGSAFRRMVVGVPRSPPSGQRATIGVMGTVLLVLVVVLVIAGLVYGVVTLLAGEDPGLSPADPDGRARPLPNNRSLSEYDL